MAPVHGHPRSIFSNSALAISALIASPITQTIRMDWRIDAPRMFMLRCQDSGYAVECRALARDIRHVEP